MGSRPSVCVGAQIKSVFICLPRRSIIAKAGGIPSVSSVCFCADPSPRLILFPVGATVASMGEAEAIAAAPASPRKPPGMFSYLLFIVFPVVIYVLGTGPAVKYQEAYPGTAAAKAIDVAYLPLIELSMIYPPIENLLKGYVGLWVE